MLQCVAVCCSCGQCVAHCVTVCVTMCCRVLPCVTVSVAVCYSVIQFVPVCRTVASQCLDGLGLEVPRHRRGVEVLCETCNMSRRLIDLGRLVLFNVEFLSHGLP